MKKTIVYIDGFNLYYGALRDTPYKWVDLMKLCEYILPGHNIVGIKYFTAIIHPENYQQKHLNQQIYLRALKTLPKISIFIGKFTRSVVSMPLAGSDPKNKKLAKVIQTRVDDIEVSLASHFLNDAFTGVCNFPVILSSDASFSIPLSLVRDSLDLPIGLINPQKTTPRMLLQNVTFIKKIRPTVLLKCQFPDVLKDTNGQFRKPQNW